MNVVLPAPLLPINPTTLSRSTATLMSAAAVTAPKFLFSPLASRTTAMSGRPSHSGEQRPQPARQEHDHQQHGGAERHLPGVRRVFVGEAADGFENERAEEGRQHVAGAGQNGHEDELPGSVQEGILGTVGPTVNAASAAP